MKNCMTAALLAVLATAAAGQTTKNTAPHGNPGARSQPVTVKQNQTTTTGTNKNTTATGNTAANAANMPGREQLDLARFTIGEWTATANLWNQPNTQPVISTGRARFYSTMSGRFVATDLDCQFNGQPVKASGLYGFNNGEKRYESTWVDNQTSAIFFFTGVRQDRTITWNSSFTDAQTGARKNLRAVEVFGENTINYTMFESTSGGGEFKKLEITYTRSGPGGPVESTPIETRTNTTRTPQKQSNNTTPNNINPNATPFTGTKPNTPGSKTTTTSNVPR